MKLRPSFLFRYVDPWTYCVDGLAVGARLTVDTSAAGGAGPECFEHAHADLHSVYDFSWWAVNHAGNEDVFRAGRANPIAQWAERDGATALPYPASHGMDRWSGYKSRLTYVGRLL